MNKKIILDKTADVFMECNVTTFPIDCFAILKHYDFKLYTYQECAQKYPELYDMCCIYSKDAYRYKKRIFYSNSNIYTRIRFSLMHELGHYLFGHDGNKESPSDEAEANYFASHILVPRAVMYKAKADTPEKLQSMFGISQMAAKIALQDYNPTRCYTTERLWQYFDSVWNPPLSDKAERFLHHDLKERLQYSRAFSVPCEEDINFSIAEAQYLYGF